MKIVLVLIAVFLGFIAWKKTHPKHLFTGAPSEIAGSWDSGCRTVPLQPTAHPTPWRIQVTYAGTGSEELYILYADPACQLPLAFSRAVSSALFEPADGPGESGYHLNSTYSNFYWTQVTKEGADASNAKLFYGKSWTAQVEQEVTNLPISPGMPATELSGAKIYDIVRPEGAYLIFGDNASGDRSIEAKRPTQYEDQSKRYQKVYEPLTPESINHQGLATENRIALATAPAAAAPEKPQSAASFFSNTNSRRAQSRGTAADSSSDYNCTCTCWYDEPGGGGSLVCNSGTSGRNCRSSREYVKTRSREECLHAPFKAGYACSGTTYTGKQVMGKYTCQ